MIPPFDIFRAEGSDAVVWCGVAQTLEEAKVRVGELAAISPGEYIILSRITGNKTIVRGGEPDVG